MKKRNLQLLALSLFLVLAQNSLAVKLEQGTGSEAASDETVAIGISFTDEHGIVHKNIAGDPTKPTDPYYATAIGIANIASGKRSSAFGSLNIASGHESTAFGYLNTASGKYSSAFGNENTASGESSTAFGRDNTVSGKYAIAFGRINTASGQESTAFGNINTASGKYSSAFGYWNTASGECSSALGNGNKASGEYSTAFGTDYEVSGQHSGAFGSGNLRGIAYGYKNEGNNSYMIGNMNRIASGSDDNFILGNNVKIGAGITGSVVLGDGSASGGTETVSVGSSTLQRKIVNVGDAAISNTSTEAVTGKQLYGIAKATSSDIDVDAWKTKLGVGSVGTPIDAYTKTESNNKFVDKTAYNTDKATFAKKDASDLSASDVSAWKSKLGVGSGGTPIDAYTKTESDNKFVDKTAYNTDKATFATKTDLGKFADATSTDINVAAWKAKLGVGSVGAGIANGSTATGSLALGEGTTVTGNYSTAVGYKNTVSGNNSGAFGDPNIVTGNSSYAFGNNNTINGNNNFVLGNNVTIGSSIQNSVALGNNSTVSSSNEVSVGSATQKRKITNVADGEVSATSTDAVTGKQLYSAMQNSGALGVENLRNDVYEKIDNVKDEMRGVGSLSAALAGLHPMQYDPKAPAQIMAALGHYKNRQAVAVGASYYFNDRFMMSTGVALSGEKKTKAMANVGFTLKLGKGSGVTYEEAPQYVVQNEVKRLTVENQELKSQVNAQGIENKELKERVQKLEEKLNKLLKTK